MNTAILTSGFTSIFTTYSYTDGEDVLLSSDTSLEVYDQMAAGRAWARVYRLFAATASVPFGVPMQASLEAAEETLAGALGAAFIAGFVSSAALAESLASAFTAFWLTPPVQVGVELVPTGSVTAVAGTAALQSALAPLTSYETPLTAGNLVTALGVFTATVVVTNTVTGMPANLV